MKTSSSGKAVVGLLAAVALAIGLFALGAFAQQTNPPAGLVQVAQPFPTSLSGSVWYSTSSQQLWMTDGGAGGGTWSAIMQAGVPIPGTASFAGTPIQTAGVGVHIGASRVVPFNSPNAAIDCAGAGLTPTVAQVLDNTIFTCATAQNLTLPTAQGSGGLVQSLPGYPTSVAVGDVFYIHVAENHATNLLTLVAGTGGTIYGIAGTTNGGREWRCRVTAITAGSESYTCY